MSNKKKIGERVYIYVHRIFLKIPPFKTIVDDMVLLILCLNTKVCIVCEKPHKIIWNNCVWKKTNKERYECSGHEHCHESLVIREGRVLTKLLSSYNHTHHILNKNDNCRKDLIYEIIEAEIAKNVVNETLLDTITVQQQYSRVEKKYAHAHPDLQLLDFTSYKSMHNRLYNKKSASHKLESINVSEYIADEYEKTLKLVAPSYLCRQQLKQDIVLTHFEDNLLISHRQLIRVLFKSNGMGSDGTFNVIPFFAKQSTPQVAKTGRNKLHRQVWNIYAFKSYVVNDRKITISYFIATALLISKYEEEYSWALDIIKQWANEDATIEDCAITEYIADFEVSQRNAVKHSWLQKHIKVINGEEFHFKAAVYKNIVSKRLGSQYKNTRNISKNNNSNNKKKTSEYDLIFRKCVQLLFNLMYIKVNLAKQFLMIIMKNLWHYIQFKHQQSLDTQKDYLHWIKYFLQYWCSYKPEEVKQLLGLSGRLAEYCLKPGSTRAFEIQDWNLYGKDITNSNSIEVNNRWTRHIMGYHPVIGKFIQVSINRFHENIKRYNDHQISITQSAHYQNRRIKKKQDLIRKYSDTVSTWKDYIEFSAKITMNKYNSNNNKLHHYFSDLTGDEEIADAMVSFHYTDTNFNSEFLPKCLDTDTDDDNAQNCIFNYQYNEAISDISQRIPQLAFSCNELSFVRNVSTKRQRTKYSLSANHKQRKRRKIKHLSCIPPLETRHKSSLNVTNHIAVPDTFNQLSSYGDDITNISDCGNSLLTKDNIPTLETIPHDTIIHSTNSNRKASAPYIAKTVLSRQITFGSKDNRNEIARIEFDPQKHERRAKTKFNIERQLGHTYMFNGNSSDDNGLFWHQENNIIKQLQKQAERFCCGLATGDTMVFCDADPRKRHANCREWYHIKCISDELRALVCDDPNIKWFCEHCKDVESEVENITTTNNEINHERSEENETLNCLKQKVPSCTNEVASSSTNGDAIHFIDITNTNVDETNQKKSIRNESGADCDNISDNYSKSKVIEFADDTIATDQMQPKSQFDTNKKKTKQDINNNNEYTTSGNPTRTRYSRKAKSLVNNRRENGQPYEYHGNSTDDGGYIWHHTQNQYNKQTNNW